MKLDATPDDVAPGLLVGPSSGTRVPTPPLRGRVTMQQVAAEAGLSRVTLHRRGVTKDALLGGLVERATEALRARTGARHAVSAP